MPNMSYCRFHNTLIDLKDCADALSELEDLSSLSETERKAALKLMKLCGEIAHDSEHFDP